MKKLNNEQMENLQGGVYAPIKCIQAIMATIASNGVGDAYAQGISDQANYCLGW